MAASPEPAPTGTTRARGSSFMKVGGRLDFSLTRDISSVNEQGSHSRSNSASALMSAVTSYEPQTQIPSGTANNNNNTTTTTTPEPTSPPPAAAATAAAAGSPPTGRQRSASYISVTGTGLDRRTSYNHTRDTSFDEYVQQRRSSRNGQGQGQARQHKSQGSNDSSNSGSASSRSSLGSLGPRLVLSQSRSATTHMHKHSKSNGNGSSTSLKDEVDEAMGAEFGWGSASRTSSQESVMAGGTPLGIAVGGGAVAGARGGHEGGLGRAPSDGSEAGVLGSVPEGPGDELESEGGAGRRGGVEEARRALLGEGEGEGEEDGGGVGMTVYTDVEVGGGGRPRGMSETIEFVVTPPPRTSSEERRDMRKTWGAAYARP